MVKWCGDTSQVTTHNELYYTNKAYLFSSSNGRPPKPLNVQFAQILGGKMEAKIATFLAINRAVFSAPN